MRPSCRCWNRWHQENLLKIRVRFIIPTTFLRANRKSCVVNDISLRETFLVGWIVQSFRLHTWIAVSTSSTQDPRYGCSCIPWLGNQAVRQHILARFQYLSGCVIPQHDAYCDPPLHRARSLLPCTLAHPISRRGHRRTHAVMSGDTNFSINIFSYIDYANVLLLVYRGLTST